MAKTRKRVLSLVLSLVMVLSLLPIQALAAVSISCTASDGAVITVTGDIPENAVVTAVPVPVELEGMKTLGAYDINITVDGAAWQPESPVEVSIESPAFEGYEELSVFHVDTDQALDYIDQYFGFLEQIMNFIKGLFSRKISSDVVSFMAEHFSIYAVGAPYVATYQFYDGPAGTDAQIIDSATQILKAGEEVQLPAAPAGDGIFQGWYIDGTTLLAEGAVAEVPREEDEIYNVYPKFEGVYYVYFLNENGQVVETIQTPAGQETAVSTEVASFVPTGNFKLVGWTLKEGGQVVASVSEANATADGAVYLYPVLQAAYWVHFDAQGGTAVESQSVQAGDTVSEPAEPTRTGYTFDGWYTEAVGGDKVPFPYQPADTTTLYAHWTAGGTKYTVVYWLQDANDREKYNYYSSEEKRGAAGQEVTLNGWEAKEATVKNGDGRDVTIGTFARSETAVIKGDGTTVLNVYLDLVEFTFTFDLDGSSRTMTIGGETYGKTLICGTEAHTHDWFDCYEWQGLDHVLVCNKTEHRHSSSCYESNVYAPKFVYGQDVSKLWPSRETATFNFNFGGWSPSVSDSDWVTKRPVITADMLPSSGTTVTLEALSDTTERTVGYWFEALPGQQGTYSYTYNETTFIRSDEYSQTYYTDWGSSLSAKEIAGMTKVSNGYNFADSIRQPDDDYDFLYTRNRYTLSFSTQGGTASVASQTMMFEQSLSGKAPDTYVEGVTTKAVNGVTYTFTGWYTVPECYSNSKVDFDTTTMPASDLALYAGWDSQKETVYVYLTLEEGTEAAKTWAITYGQSVQAYLDNNSLVMPEVDVASDQKFVGWCIREADGSLTLYSLDAPVTGDLHLYPLVVSTAGYTVTYFAGDGSGDVPVDNQKYQYGSKASVLPGSDLIAPTGMVFSHWTYDEEEYLPNDQVEIPNHDVTLTAVFVEKVTVEEVTVTYDANAVNATGSTAPQTVKLNDKFTVAGCGFTREGYSFIGWATEEDPASGTTLIRPGAEMRADNDGANILYAQWEQASYPGTSITVKVFVDGQEVTNDGDLIQVQAWEDRTEDFTEAVKADGTGDFQVDYSYEKYNCADFQILLQESAYVPQAVVADLTPTSQAGSVNLSGSTFSLDNVTGGTTVKVYLCTPYRVAYEGDDVTAVDDGTYVVSATTGAAWSDASLSSTISLAALPNDTAEKTYDGWYLNEDGTGQKYMNSVAVSAVQPASGTTITFYATSAKVYYDYTVVYYYDDVLANEKTETGTGVFGTQVTEYTAKLEDGYALDYVENLPLTISANAEENVIKVYYATDANGDEIPDRYQATVTYEVVNGTWSDDSSAAKESVFTLYTYENGVWTKTDPAPTLGSTIPTGMKPDSSHTGSGAWDAQISSSTEVTEAVTYTYTFSDLKSYEIEIEVVNGSADKVSPVSVTHGSSVKITFTAEEGYALDVVTVDGQAAELDGSGSYTFSNVTADHSIKVEYATDANGDEIPDRYQATVTYEVVNGTWSDDSSAAKESVFTLYTYENGVWTKTDPAPTLGSTIPTGMKPDSSHTGSGAWDAQISSSTEVTEAVTYTYTFSDLKSYEIEIEVVNGSADKVSPVSVTHGSSVKITFTAEEGYALDVVTVDGQAAELDGSGSYTFSNVTADHSIKVEYATDANGDDIPDKYQVFLKFVADEGGKVSETNRTITFPDNADSGTVSVDDVTATADQDYLFGQWTNGYNTDVCATAILNASIENVPGNTTITFTARFDKDVLVDPSEKDKTPDKPGDGIPDKYQVTVYYRAVNGTVSMPSTVVTKKDTNGNPAENGTAKLAEAHIPTATPIAGYVAAGNLWTPVTPDVGLPVVDGQTFTANYVYIPPYIPPTDPGTDIDDEDVPLADLPGLNTVDHYAYIAGYEDGTVRPNNNITRAEVATIFFRLFTDEYRETYWSTNNPFSDVAYTAWYNNAVSTTANAGIIAGYPDGTFLPNNYITRAEFATIAARFLSGEYVGPDLFTDISGHWAAEYINRAANAGWINGYPDGSFRPNAYITRAEAMTLVNSMLGRMPHKDHMLENMVKWPDNPEAAWYYEAVQEATNGHDYDWYEEEDQLFYEIWTALQPNRDWAALEKEWSNAYSAPGGEVIG